MELNKTQQVKLLSLISSVNALFANGQIKLPETDYKTLIDTGNLIADNLIIEEEDES